MEKELTHDEMTEELEKRFGNKFYNELGTRTGLMQKEFGFKVGKMNTMALDLAKLVVKDIWKEWVLQCSHEWTIIGIDEGGISTCNKCGTTEDL